MTARGGEVWVQPTYYPFAHLAKYGKREVLLTRQNGPCYSCEDFGGVPYVDSVAVYQEDSGEITLFLVNRNAVHVYV